MLGWLHSPEGRANRKVLMFKLSSQLVCSINCLLQWKGCVQAEHPYVDLGGQ